MKYLWNHKDFEQLKNLTGKKIIIFGAGSTADNIYEKYIKNINLNIAYVIENDEKKLNSKFKGFNIFSSSILKQENNDQIVFIILTQDYVSVTNQLRYLGFNDFYCYRHIYSNIILKEHCFEEAQGKYLHHLIDNNHDNFKFNKDLKNKLTNILKSSIEDSLKKLEWYKIYEQAMTEYFDSDFFKNHSSISDSEFSIYSQYGEDGVIQWILNKLEVKHKTFIEFGVQNYTESNTRYLYIKNKYKGLIIDGDSDKLTQAMNDPDLKNGDLICVNAFITKDNINQIFIDNGFVGDIDILSIDIDGNDYWVWESINCVNPQIVICEFNMALGGYEHPFTIPYKEDFVHLLDGYLGASIKALEFLSKKKGYSLLYITSDCCNCFFIRDDLKEIFKDTLEEESKDKYRYLQKKIYRGKSYFGNILLRSLNSRSNVYNVETGELVQLNPSLIF